MIPCIDVGLIPFSSDASLMRRMNTCWMIATLEHVAVIYLGWLQPIKSFALDSSGLESLKSVMRLLRNAHLVNTFILKSTPILLRYTPSFPLAHFPNGGLIIFIVSLPQPGGMLTSSWLLTILQSGLRPCLHMRKIVTLSLSSYSIMS